MKLFGPALALGLSCVVLHAQTAQPNAAQHHESSGVQPGMDMHHDKPPAPPSKGIRLTYAANTMTLTAADLAALPQVTVHVHNAHLNKDEDYTGPLLSDVLAKVGFVVSHETEPAVLHSTVMASATDHYYVLYSMAEVQPSFSNGKVIVALVKSGLPDTEGGMIQLINTDGAKPARWVHGLSNLDVLTLSQNK